MLVDLGKNSSASKPGHWDGARQIYLGKLLIAEVKQICQCNKKLRSLLGFVCLSSFESAWFLDEPILKTQFFSLANVNLLISFHIHVAVNPDLLLWSTLRRAMQPILGLQVSTWYMFGYMCISFIHFFGLSVHLKKRVWSGSLSVLRRQFDINWVSEPM